MYGMMVPLGKVTIAKNGVVVCHAHLIALLYRHARAAFARKTNGEANMHQANNHDPMHGITLEKMLIALVHYYGWGELGIHVKIRCFNANPSIKSSLTFLRKTPWARTKVEYLYGDMLEEKKGHVQDDVWAKAAQTLRDKR